MSSNARVRTMAALLHRELCLRWPTLLAIALIPRRRSRVEQGGPESILVVRPDGLGDCILTLPLLRTLRECFPSARITVLTTLMAVPLLASLPEVDATIVVRPTFSPRWPKYLRGLLGSLRTWFRELRQTHFDVAILPRWDADIYHATLLCALSGAAVRVGYADSTTAYKQHLCRGFQRAWTILLPPGPVRHEALCALDTAASLGYACITSKPRIGVTVKARNDARTWLYATLAGALLKRSLIAIGLPAAEAKKRWPATLYLEALQEIVAELPVVLVFFSDADTAAVAHHMREALPTSCIAQQLPLMLAAAVLAECTLFIGMDSGLGHLAAAVGCETITLFAQAADCEDHTGWHSNSPKRFRPLSERGIVLQPRQSRHGCEAGCRHAEPHCILDITPEQVSRAALHMLHNPPQRDQHDLAGMQVH